MARLSSTVEAIGFSTMMWMPRAAQSIAMSRCRCVGAAMVTASTPWPSNAVGIVKSSTTELAGNSLAALAVGIGDADQFYARQFGQDAGMVAAHHAYADNADAQRIPGKFRSITHKPPRYPEPTPPVFP